MMPPREIKVQKLSDEFGQFELQLTCSACGHERHANPRSLAHLVGWDVLIEDIEKRLRCSKCQKRACHIRIVPMRLPRRARPARRD